MKLLRLTFCLALCILSIAKALCQNNIGINVPVPLHVLHIKQAPGATLGNGEAVVRAEYTGAYAGDAIAVYGSCTPGNGSGIGGLFFGGFVGVEGVVQTPDDGEKIGTAGIVDGGNGPNYGIYGAANGTGVNYAGWFGNGNVYIDNKLGIGVNPVHSFDLSATQGVARLTSTASVNGSVLELKNITALPTHLGAINFSLTGGATPGQIAYLANNNLTFRVNSLERFRIGSNGFFGFNNSNPQHPLHINQPSGVVLNGNESLMDVEYTGTNAVDAIGIRGKCKPQDYFGIGGEFEGGWVGVKGKVNGSGGAGTQYYGVRGESSAPTGTKYGVYGVATGNGTNWAGYFEGRVYAGTRIGIGREPLTHEFEVEGNASKFTAGDWVANSDARLKKNIEALDSREMLDKVLALQGITYEWNDDKTGGKRPEGVQFGFTAQNIQEVFPTLVNEDALGYLQTAYGTYDAMMVEAIRALHDQNTSLDEEIASLKRENARMASDIQLIKSMLNTMIALDKE